MSRPTPTVARSLLLRASLVCGLFAVLEVLGAGSLSAAELPANRWVELVRDAVGARRGSAIRYAPATDRFVLWGFQNADYGLLQEREAMTVPEYDVVAFDAALAIDPDAERKGWENLLPRGWETKWGTELPRTYYPRTYSGITNGSEESRFRPPPGFPNAPPRPDPNMVFGQVAYHPPTKSLFYFAGRLTLLFDVKLGLWTNLEPEHTPPPVIGASLCHDPEHDEMILFGGGHVAEKGPHGSIVGYTGTWAYSFAEKDWKRLETKIQPPPRMNSRIVRDEKHGLLVLFGGDGQDRYLADTWLFDLESRQWRRTSEKTAPPARGGHFTVYDPQSGQVIIGGGYQRENLSDLWAYDVAADRWQKLPGDVPTGFTISADIAPAHRLILLTTNTKRPGDGSSCNELFPVRTTYAYRLGGKSLPAGKEPGASAPVLKRPPEERNRPFEPDAERAKSHAMQLEELPENRWVRLDDPGFAAPARTWGSATLDTDRDRILLWGGGHCGYGGNDVDEYDIAQHTWVGSKIPPSFPERTWNLGVREAGVTFRGAPWVTHGRTTFAYDPVLKKMLSVRTILLTAGYDPSALAEFPADRAPQAGALVEIPTSYRKYVTFEWDPLTTKWKLRGPGVVGLDTLVSTPRGVMGVNVDWPSHLKDSGHALEWTPELPPADTMVYGYDGKKNEWKRLGEKQESPQNLYEMTALAYDMRRDRVMLHGGGENRDELWSFDVESGRWENLAPRVLSPKDGRPPVTNREMVYVPEDDVLLTYGAAREDRRVPMLWVYECAHNVWRRVEIDPPPGLRASAATSPTRALIYDPQRKLAFLVLATGGNLGRSVVYALKYRHAAARFVSHTDHLDGELVPVARDGAESKGHDADRPDECDCVRRG